ncbi:polysaccharide biosynthesis C-terminal domain-containing protein, partial [Flavobacteriaceae bacterium]|nr:polysaccharide biosynthesis C-terminal domain-containing protein [Flavobacteriaceae bacterium]
YSGPLIPNSISWWLIMSANKYIILYFLGKEALGIFGFSNRFPGLLVMVNSIFIMAWQESAILNFNKEGGDLFFSKIFDFLIKIQVSFAVILILTSELLINYVVSDEFYESWKYMPFLYLGASFSTFAGFYGSIYLSAKDTKSSLRTTLVAGILNVLTALLLVKSYGLFGVSFANALSFLFLVLYRFYHTKKIITIRNNLSTIYISIILLSSSFIIIYQKNTILTVISVFVIMPIIFLFNKKIINKISQQIKKKIHGIS